MLIVNDEQRLRAGIRSLSKRCSYCSQTLATYPLILSDDARLEVYHAACAIELATEILVDLYTFFRPPRTASCLCLLRPRRFLAHEEGLWTQRISKRSRPRCGCKPATDVPRCAIHWAK